MLSELIEKQKESEEREFLTEKYKSDLVEKQAKLKEMLAKKEELLAKRKAIREQNEECVASCQKVRERIEQIEKRRELMKPYEKQLLNKYLEYKGNIRVFIRSRPILAIDFRAYEGSRDSFDKIEKSTSIINDKQIELRIQDKNHLFFFDNVFGPDKNQEHIYDEVRHLVQSFLDGHDVCIFSYGQTGSGKTFTMGTDASSLVSEAT